MTSYSAFAQAVAALAPRTAIVLGSGLAGAAAAFVEHAAVSFAAIPGWAVPTVAGHGGRVVVGEWGGTPALLFQGRLHFYEGHPWSMVTTPIRMAQQWGITRIILTNAAGGIHPALTPGSVMALRGHLAWLTPQSWRQLARGQGLSQPYTPRLLQLLHAHEQAHGRTLFSGIYAALTGPSYETPAEIRALAICGADAVGMSTAMEAEEAARWGLEVAGISCITNKAAGLGETTLAHAEVLINAHRAVARVGELLCRLIHEPSR
ncbi:MAG: purine-nucleoside phosphorylase [Gemmataceae bacterium]|nr:purine-nucleoside phosphorylase [Gemmata sp.]MDW8197889.1 purine-nucleoside phosphorylase [Gemmataceae bacterium]